MASRPGGRPLSHRQHLPATSAPPNTQGRRVPIEITRRIEVPPYDPTSAPNANTFCDVCKLWGHSADECAEVAPPLPEGEASRVSVSELPASAISPRGNPPQSSRRAGGAPPSQTPLGGAEDARKDSRPGEATGRANQSPREVPSGTGSAEPGARGPSAPAHAGAPPEAAQQSTPVHAVPASPRAPAPDSAKQPQPQPSATTTPAAQASASAGTGSGAPAAASQRPAATDSPRPAQQAPSELPAASSSAHADELRALRGELGALREELQRERAARKAAEAEAERLRADAQRSAVALAEARAAASAASVKDVHKARAAFRADRVPPPPSQPRRLEASAADCLRFRIV